MKQRPAFSLLELMIALVLLGVLSALAWSILDNFRTAEQRGWKVASRLQAIRSARLWLEEDLLHVSEHFAQSDSQITTRMQPVSFQGTQTGFSITYHPSIDPLPWLEELVLNSQDTATSSASSQNRYTRLGLYTVEARYQLQGTGLIRTITSQAPSAPSNSANSLINDIEPVEPTLTVNDLYRQSDRVDQLGSLSSSLSQSELSPLYRPRFRYHDGRTWKSSWVATSTAALPTAIEFSFDLVATETTLPSDRSTPGPKDSLESELPDPLAEVEVPVVELDDDVSEAMLQEPRQIRVVVKLPWINIAPRSDGSDSPADLEPANAFNDGPMTSGSEEASE